VDFTEFTCFYDFVFFMCRENGQKNITISRAITAWKLVLAGRFRLLNRWCDFIEVLFGCFLYQMALCVCISNEKEMMLTCRKINGTIFQKILGNKSWRLVVVYMRI
jgi:hypothetical protein